MKNKYDLEEQINALLEKNASALLHAKPAVDLSATYRRCLLAIEKSITYNFPELHIEALYQLSALYYKQDKPLRSLVVLKHLVTICDRYNYLSTGDDFYCKIKSLGFTKEVYKKLELHSKLYGKFQNILHILQVTTENPDLITAKQRKIEAKASRAGGAKKISGALEVPVVKLNGEYQGGNSRGQFEVQAKHQAGYEKMIKTKYDDCVKYDIKLKLSLCAVTLRLLPKLKKLDEGVTLIIIRRLFDELIYLEPSAEYSPESQERLDNLFTSACNP